MAPYLIAVDFGGRVVPLIGAGEETKTRKSTGCLSSAHRLMLSPSAIAPMERPNPYSS
jgi:hypothetical protein